MATPRPSDVWRLGDAVTPEEKLVLLALIDYGDRIHPSQGTLSIKTGYCVRTIRTLVASLRTKGMLTTSQRGAKSLDYVVVLTGSNAANRAGSMRQAMPINPAGDAAQCGKPCRGIRTSQGTSQENHPPAGPARGVESPWDGIDQEDQRRIRNWVPRGADELCDAQRRVTLRRLADLGIRVTDHPRWWRRLGERWGQVGVPPYDQIALELQSIGPDVRDRLAVLAFRLGLGKVAA